MISLHMSRFTLSTFMVSLLFVLPVALALAGDEEMMNPYTEFDPETGFFIPIDQSTGYGSPEGTDVVARNPDSKVQSPVSAEVIEPTTINPPLILTFSIIGITLILFGVGFFWHRKSRESSR